jgi:hypothetical protein
MSILGDSLARGLTSVTREFTRAKHRAAERPLSQRDLDWLRARERRKEKATIKTAAWQMMAQAYAEVSDNGSLPAKARQIMYSARRSVLPMTGGKCWETDDYFTQHMLPEYMAEYPDETANWDVVFDARGHFHEPHTDYQIALGTLEVRDYINIWSGAVSDKLDKIELESRWPTMGPANRYKFALFIEKEGFKPLCDRSQIQNRYDIGLFSTKGMSVTSARTLVEALSREGVTILVMHDFDLSGLTICHTLCHDTRRFKFKVDPKIIDLGLRLEDAQAMGLQSEPVEIKQRKDPREKFLEEDYDVSDEELDFLVRDFHRAYRGGKDVSYWSGERVELNAMTSRQLIDWLEGKFKEHGVPKVVPDQETLTAAWRRAKRIELANRKVAEAIAKSNAEQFVPPDNLVELVSEQLKPGMASSWDEIIARMVKHHLK